jgi:hypothetical protein
VAVTFEVHFVGGEKVELQASGMDSFGRTHATASGLVQTKDASGQDVYVNIEQITFIRERKS